jgi:anthranilate synthase
MNVETMRADRFKSGCYLTPGGIAIRREVSPLPSPKGIEEIIQELNREKGALFSSSYDYPGRYTRWDIGFVNPALELRGMGLRFSIKALKDTAGCLLEPIYSALQDSPDIASAVCLENVIKGQVKTPERFFPEDQRSRQATIFSVIRIIKDLLGSPEDSFLGLYGAFGYDLVFQFEDLQMKHQREKEAADLCLFIPDRLLVIDHRMMQSACISYHFSAPGKETVKIPAQEPLPKENRRSPAAGNSPPGRYASLVREAHEYFARGDLFEVVPSHVIYEPCHEPASQVYLNLKGINPSPYGFLINLGQEYLIGASPEMYVRVEGERIETCPISGTIARGQDALEDAEQIRKLLNSKKDEAELTMCTDVDRNDKSRICEPDSVRVIGRRQIEMYSHLIHTVDHVEGRLREGFDCLDAFLTHMWAVTVTGAPKKAALQWVEDHEDSPRRWYGGAVGYLAFDGHLNTGLTLRTIRLQDGMAEIRVGATLLADSVPEEEEAETHLKAAALKKALHSTGRPNPVKTDSGGLPGLGKKVILVDHEDSFVHTLASYFRSTGCQVAVMRPELARRTLQSGQPCDLLVLSPGPGRPSEFALADTISLGLKRRLPIFGVCLGLQGVVEYFGGRLGQLAYPQHGKLSTIQQEENSILWDGLPGEFQVGRYHSLYAQEIPSCLKVTARSRDQVPMAVEHREMPVFAVQFHPESIMSSENGSGQRLIKNLIRWLALEAGEKYALARS